MMSLDDIDEINAYANTDGTFTVELQTWAIDKTDNTKCRATIEIPHAHLDLSITSARHGLSYEIKLEG